MDISSGISAIVTGGASGLGEATARALRNHGVAVTIFDIDSKRGPAIAAEIGGHFEKVDVTCGNSVTEGFAGARAANGQERILINCAGIVMGAKTVSRDRTTGEFTSFPMDQFERVIAINLIGAFRCLSQSAAGMASLEPKTDGERGVIVNTSSIAATDGQIGQAAYAASKAGVMGLTLPGARDLASFGIRLTSIMPGIMQTPMMAGMPEAVQAGLGASVPFPQRLGYATEFASLVLEICRNRYLNGECIRLDGAIRMPPR